MKNLVRVLAIGDIVGYLGCKTIKENLKRIKFEKKIDFIIANGENSAVGNGITQKSADFLLNAGINVLTGGNHTFKRREFFDYIDKSKKVIRPANYPDGTPGKGYAKFVVNGCNICVINLSGLTYLEPLSCPFVCIDDIIEKTEDCKIRILDFHAEATSEKRAMGFYVDGRISAIFGTHTHVQTSDEEILPKGTAYITDVGMTGKRHSVLGVRPEISIQRMKGKIPIRFECDDFGSSKIEGVCFDIDESTGKSLRTERLRFIFE